MNILITGGLGYTGTVLVDHLLRHNGNFLVPHHITILDNLYFKQYNVLARTDWLKERRLHIDIGDIRNYFNEKYLSKFGVIIHLAALVGAPLCDRVDKLYKMQYGLFPTPTYDINTKAVKTLCENLSPEQYLIYPNTNSGYGKCDTICTEETPFNPLSSYGKTKAEAEKYVMERKNSTSLRLATVFGASHRMRIDLLVNDFIKQLYYYHRLEIFQPHVRRNYIHVEDLARAYNHAIAHKSIFRGKVFNVGNDTLNMTKQQLATWIAASIKDFKHLEILPAVVTKEGLDPDQRDYNISSAKLYMTNFQCYYGLSHGINELARLFSAIPASATEHMKNV